MHVVRGNRMEGALGGLEKREDGVKTPLCQ